MEIRHHKRYDFRPLPERPVYDWPGGKRLAVSLCNNIEWFSFMTGLGSDHTLPGAAQTTRNPPRSTAAPRLSPEFARGGTR
jgi:hypothetical protein